MGIQLTYNTSQGAAFAGLLASESFATSLRSAINGDPQTNGIPFGLAMAAGAAPAQGAVDRKVILPVAADVEFLGIGVHTHAVNNIGLGSGANGMPQLGQISLLDIGDIWVKVEEAVLVDGPVFVRFTSDGGSNTQIGSFRTSVDSARAVRLAGAKYLTAAAAGGYAIVRYIKGGSPGDKAFSLAVALASASATVTNFVLTTPADRYLKLLSASLYNATGLAQDTTNYFALQLVGGASTDLADYSTLTTAQGTITAATPALMVAGTASLVPPSTTVKLVSTLHGSQTLPAGTFVLNGYYI